MSEIQGKIAGPWNIGHNDLKNEAPRRVKLNKYPKHDAYQFTCPCSAIWSLALNLRLVLHYTYTTCMRTTAILLGCTVSPDQTLHKCWIMPFLRGDTWARVTTSGPTTESLNRTFVNSRLNIFYVLCFWVICLLVCYVNKMLFSDMPPLEIEGGSVGLSAGLLI